MNGLTKPDRITIIAEIAQSYEGDFIVLKEICRKLGNTKVDGIMFQVVYADELATPENVDYNFFKMLEFSEIRWKEIVSMIQHNNKLAIGEVFGIESALMMKNMGIDALKIHTSDLANIELLKLVSGFKTPLIVGIGSATGEEIQFALDILRSKNCTEIVLMHGYQLCPTPLEDSHLLKIRALYKKFNLPIGYSDHVAGSINSNSNKKNLYADLISLVAVGCGARIIEKHVMLDRTKKWEDHSSALTPEEFSEFANLVNVLSRSLGNSTMERNSAEMVYRKTSKKHIVCGKDLDKCHILSEQDLLYKRIDSPEKGIVNSYEVVGKRLLKKMKYNEPVIKKYLEK